MYELANWGTPVAPAELAQRERVSVNLPVTVVRVLRSRARAQGVSLETMVDRVLHDALALHATGRSGVTLTAID